MIGRNLKTKEALPEHQLTGPIEKSGGGAVASVPRKDVPLRDPSVATVGRCVSLKGTISSEQDLYLDGEVDGAIELLANELTIGPKGHVKAGIKARDVVILGTVYGVVEASGRIEIRRGATLVGDIRTPRIIIEDGAYFKGSIDIVRVRANRLALAGSPQAETADERAEQEIQAGQYATFDNEQSFYSSLLDKETNNPIHKI